MHDVSFRTIKYARHRSSDLLITIVQQNLQSTYGIQSHFYSIEIQIQIHTTYTVMFINRVEIYRGQWQIQRYATLKKWLWFSREFSGFEYCYSAIIVAWHQCIASLSFRFITIAQNTFYETIWWKCQHQHQTCIYTIYIDNYINSTIFWPYTMQRNANNNNKFAIDWWLKIYVLICSHSIKWNSNFKHIYILVRFTRSLSLILHTPQKLFFISYNPLQCLSFGYWFACH